MNFLWGLLGIATVFFIAFLFSTNRKAIRPRTVLGGLAIQIGIAFVALYWTVGQEALQWLTVKASNIIEYSQQGSGFLFGDLLGVSDAPVFAFEILTVIIFFSSLIGVLYYIGVMQWVVKIIGGAIHVVLGTSKAESFSATANIFVGQTEAPLVVRPFLEKMTQSELFAVMTGGLASVAGSVLFGYAALGIPLDYLLAASFMAAPAGLVMAKMIMPETAKSAYSDEKVDIDNERESQNVIDAAARGAAVGLKLALNVGAMLLAFIALIALVNGILGGIGGWFGWENLTLEGILGLVFAPIAFAIGVPWAEAVQAGSFIGQKVILNEFVAYANFAPGMEQFSEKTVAIITFALCGFANIASLAIILGGIGGLVPSRRDDLAKMGLRAVLAGTLASLLSASIAGMMIG